jgi:hypothetical protein
MAMKAKNRQLNFDDEVFYWRKRAQIERRFFPEKLNNFAKESTPELLAAAAALDLDPANPVESAILLRALAELSFRRSSKGRPKHSASAVVKSTAVSNPSRTFPSP